MYINFFFFTLLLPVIRQKPLVPKLSIHKPVRKSNAKTPFGVIGVAIRFATTICM